MANPNASLDKALETINNVTASNTADISSKLSSSVGVLEDQAISTANGLLSKESLTANQVEVLKALLAFLKD